MPSIGKRPNDKKTKTRTHLDRQGEPAQAGAAYFAGRCAKCYHAKHRAPSHCHYWQESTLLQQVMGMAHDMKRRELFLRQDEMQTKQDNLVDRPALQLQHQVGLITVFVGTSFNPKMKEKKNVH